MLNGEIRAVYIYPHDDPNFPDKILVGGRFNASRVLRITLISPA